MFGFFLIRVINGSGTRYHILNQIQKIKLQTQRRQFEMAVDITREQWEMETERLCPSALAFNAYADLERYIVCLLYTSPSPRDQRGSRMPSSA